MFQAPSLRAITLLFACSLSAVAAAETPLERGRYLVESIVACGNCHTPQGPNGPIPGQEMAGQLLGEDKMATVYSANITPDLKTGIGGWTDAQIATAIREGRRPNGRVIGPPMPFGLYRQMSDSDVAAIVAYLRTVKPLKNAVTKSTYNFALPPTYGPPVGKVPDVPTADKVAYGRYLAGPLGHCIECHSPAGPNGAPDTENKLGAGGEIFTGPWGQSVSANITPAGLARYSDADLKKIISTGVRPDGSRLKPPMGIAYYAKMRDADLDALVAYLRSLPPK